MKATVVYGTNRKGCTYHIAQEVLQRLPDIEVTEFFMPRDLPSYCISCFNCFYGDIRTCPHAEHSVPIWESMAASDFIILTSPVYVFNVTGAMKTFLDHYGCHMMVHRPDARMFTKQALIIATGVGPVFRKTLRTMKDSAEYWGISKIYKMGYGLFEIHWNDVPARIKSRISNDATRIGARVQRRVGKVSVSLKTKLLFAGNRLMQKKFKLNAYDHQHWESQGWLDGNNPW